MIGDRVIRADDDLFCPLAGTVTEDMGEGLVWVRWDDMDNEILEWAEELGPTRATGTRRLAVVRDGERRR